MPSIRQVFSAFLLVSPSISSPLEGRDLNSYVSTERATALQGVLNNIGPNGKLSQGAASGVVIASPSTVNPDYLYTWTRDSALTMKTIVDEFIAGDRSLEQTIKNYIKANAVQQTLTNPSGNFLSGAGLGEPKFLISLSRFNGAWGRPQRDGPALRAIALMTYSDYLIGTGQYNTAKNVVWPVIANDLAYVGQYWNQSGFDLWEEVYGSSFFTIQNQHRALVQGRQLAFVLGQKCDACVSQAPEVLCFLQSFWNGSSIVSNINTNTVRSGADANSLLGAISTFDIVGSCTDGTFQPCNSKVLASHKVLVDSFRGIYGVNANRKTGTAAAIGRYAEDVYYNGNPWYLCTLSAAEVLYDAIAQWKLQGRIVVDSISQAFFKDLYPSVKTQTYFIGTSEFSKIVSAVQTYADGFVSVVQQYTPTNGSLSEQFDRSTGQPLSAYDLTWSYASFVTMSARRKGQYPLSWISRLAKPSPTKCSPSSANGTYVPATAAGAPQVSQLCQNNIIFEVNASTYYGENIYVQGNTTDLGSWQPANALGMSASNYTSDRHEWYLEVQLPAGSAVSYNYFRIESDGSYVFETTNRTLQVPACGAGGKTTNDAWVGTCSTVPHCT